MAITTAQQTNVLKIVTGLFNAAPGGANLSILADMVQGGATMAQLADALAATSTFTSGVMGGKVTTASQVAVLMTNFGLVADSNPASAGSQAQEFFTARINAGVGFGAIVNEAVNFLSQSSATLPAEFTTAATLLSNKAAVAAAYSATTSSDDLATLQNVLSTVTGTAIYTDAQVAAVLVAAGVTTGSTFTFTTGADTITGTSGNDTLSAISAATGAAATDTLTVLDTIDGGAGTDTLTIAVSATNTDITHAATISNIETINIRNTAATTVVAAYNAGTGVTTVNSDRSTGDVTITNLAAGAVVGSIGNANVANGALSATYVAGATVGTVNVSGGTTSTLAGTVGNVAIVGTGITSTVINSTGAANTIGTLTNAATSKTLTINATTGITMGALATGTDTALIVTGAAATAATPTVPLANDPTSAVQLGALTTSFATIDASAMTASGVALTLIAGITSFKGGAGTDTVTTFLTTSQTASIIDAGAGTDVLRIGAYGDVNTATKAKVYANFETVDTLALTGTALDMSLFTNSTITGLRTGVAAASSFSNVTAAQAANVTIYGSQSATTTIAVSGATTNGQIDTINLKFDDAIATQNTFTLASVVAVGTEIININAVDNATISLMTGSTSWTNTTVTGAGNVSLTTGALALNVNTAINASAATGTVLVDATNATANGAAITGTTSTAVNTLTGSAQADVITGGAGNDVLSGLAGADIINGGVGDDSITAGTGADTITGGAGVDTFVFNAAAGATTSGITTGDVITDFVVGTDKLQFAGVTAIVSVQQAAVQAAVTALVGATTTQIATAMATANTTSLGVSTAVYGNDTYVYYETTTGGTGVAADDVFIKLTGVASGATFAAAVVANDAAPAVTVNLTVANDTVTYTTDSNLIINGGGGNDTITITGAGNHTVTTLGGNDTITITGAGTHTINAGDAVSTLNTITTTGGTSIITTGANADTITTGVGNDTITAGNGANTITGNAGKDIMSGGTGVDIYAFAAGVTDTVATGSSIAGVDSITNLTLNGAAADFINATETVAAVGTAVTGSLTEATFVANMNTLLNVGLGAGFNTAAAGVITAAVVTANAGDLSGRIFLAIDVDASDTFTVADFVIEITGATLTSVTTGSFT